MAECRNLQVDLFYQILHIAPKLVSLLLHSVLSLPQMLLQFLQHFIPIQSFLVTSSIGI